MIQRKGQEHTTAGYFQALRLLSCAGLLFTLAVATAQPADAADWETAKFHDSHFHLTNYVQEGTSMPDLLDMMGDTICRSTVFGIPLQQTWSYGNTGNEADNYKKQL